MIGRGRTDVYVNDVRLGTTTEWTLNIQREYVDATVFGDTNRTYLVGLPEIVGTFQTDEGANVNFRLPWTRENRVTVEAPPEGNPELRLNDDRLQVAVEGIGTTNEQIARRLNEMYALFDFTLTTRTQDPAATEAWARQRRDQREADKKALAKSRKLLLNNLDAVQAAQAGLPAQRFTVKGEKLKYLIYLTGKVGTLKPHGTFCINPTQSMPGPDRALALKLLIENDEAEFLRVANWSGQYNGERISLGEMRIDGTVASREGGYSSDFYGQGSRPKGKSPYLGLWDPLDYQRFALTYDEI